MHPSVQRVTAALSAAGAGDEVRLVGAHLGVDVLRRASPEVAG